VKTEETASTPAEPRTYHLLSPRPYPARLSLVFPIYNEETVIPFLRREIEAFVDQAKSETEVVLVNDGSSDKSLDGLLAWASENSRIKSYICPGTSVTRSRRPRAWTAHRAMQSS
jgi:hypothetical protein